MNEYAAAGVNYKKIEPFKAAMQHAGSKTLVNPLARAVEVRQGLHGGVYEYLGDFPHSWCTVEEGLGNLNWIAEWMYEYSGTGRTYYEVIARQAALIVVIDLLAQGALPVMWEDHIAAGNDDWFMDERRSQDCADGCIAVCADTGMALPAGESPALKYLVKAEPPVSSAPVISGCVTGIIAPRTREITGQKLQAGDHILAVPSLSLGANGISLVIKRAMGLPDKFATKLSNGRLLGEECLLPFPSYVGFVESLLNKRVDIHALLPATGSGVAKLAFDKRPFTYRVHSWMEVPYLFQYMRELGVSVSDCLTTFNWGAGLYVFVPPSDVDNVIDAGTCTGHKVIDVGIVEPGERQVIFEPENEVLPPPGE